MDEMDLTATESEATYEEIKEYVLEHTGLKVSNLYIAQIKQKCGIIKRESYNKAKIENAKFPKCSVEKEKAIMDALSRFYILRIRMRIKLNDSTDFIDIIPLMVEKTDRRTVILDNEKMIWRRLAYEFCDFFGCGWRLKYKEDRNSLSGRSYRSRLH